MGLIIFHSLEGTCALGDVVSAVVSPLEVLGVSVVENFYLLSVDNEVFAIVGYVSWFPT